MNYNLLILLFIKSLFYQCFGENYKFFFIKNIWIFEKLYCSTFGMILTQKLITTLDLFKLLENHGQNLSVCETLKIKKTNGLGYK